MVNTLKKIWDVVSTAFVVFAVVCAVLLMGARLLGYQCFAVISGSMEPAFCVGDLIYVKEVDVSAIQVGDPITFVLNEDLIVATHRVVRVDAENQHFYTKGDANEIEDSAPVHFNNVIGVPKFSIPKLGYVSDFVQNPPGVYITVGVSLLMILMVFVPDMVGAGKKEKEMEALSSATGRTDEVAEENERLKAEVEKLRAEIAAKQSDDEA